MASTTPEELLTAIRSYAVGLAKGNTVDTLGAPVDIINEAIIRPILGNRTSKEPIGGSKQLRRMFGLNPEDSNPAETVGSMMSAGGAAKAMIVLAARAGKDVARADKLRKGGISEGTIFKETGTYREVGGKKSKAVISDAGASMTDQFENSRTWAQMTLPEALNHPELYKMYPELAKVTVSTYPGSGAAYVPRYGHIRVGEGQDNALGLLLHETQHAVQHKGKMQDGGSADELVHKYGLPFEKAYKEYLKLPGEQEARFTDSSKKLTQRELEEEVLKMIRQGKTPANSMD